MASKALFPLAVWTSPIRTAVVYSKKPRDGIIPGGDSRFSPPLSVEPQYSCKGIPGYARVLWEQQDECLKILRPLTKPIDEMPGNLLTWQNGSSIRGVPAGADQIRQYHPARYIMDEAAFLPEAAASYDTAEAVATQIIVVSSAGPGWFSEVCQSILDGA